MGGGTFPRASRGRGATGLSPRGRGNRDPTGKMTRNPRSIPAWAGEPYLYRCAQAPSKVYPRVGGGTIDSTDLLSAFTGLSPRGRGNPPAWATDQAIPRSIPAWAGEPRTARLSPVTFRGLSPRGRGNQVPDGEADSIARSIPAWAGEPTESDPDQWVDEVYPRVGGGTVRLVSVRTSFMGLSPRGRGNQGQGAPGLQRLRSIPAWAGEPAPCPAP